MAEVFDVLPGIVLPIREVASQLASMWKTDEPDSPLSVHASQMNVVLHFGLNIKPEPARERFDKLVKFAQRYPCRIIVLCPSTAKMGSAMESKLFSQCYIGESHRERCCCEASILRYNPSEIKHLFNQVSVWLEGDLPTYYWFSEVSLEQAKNYLDFAQKLGVCRCVFDRSNELSELIASGCPDTYSIIDLAEASLLPVRQIIGQFLSRYPVKDICAGLKAVRVCYSGALGEGRSLLKWVRSCLDECRSREKDMAFQPEFQLETTKPDSTHSLEVKFIYDSEHYFVFSRFEDGLRSELKANFGESDELVHVPLKSLHLEQALAEAFFFVDDATQDSQEL